MRLDKKEEKKTAPRRERILYKTLEQQRIVLKKLKKRQLKEKIKEKF